MNTWKQVGVVLVICLILVESVDRGNFKTCSQSGFCKRQRDHKPSEPQYRALIDTLQVKPSQISLQLLNKKDNAKLLLDVYTLKDGMVRVKINEAEPVRPRYEIPVGDSLVSDPEPDNLKVTRRDTNQVIFTFQGHEVVLQANPFKLDFFTDNEPVLMLNAKGLLKYECYRPDAPGIFGRVISWISKPFRAAEEPAVEEENNKEDEQGDEEEEKMEEEEPDTGEETFKTHHDSKPRGPSSIGVDILFPGFEFVYGLPEHADDLVLKSTISTDPYRLYNLDVFEYELHNPMALYGSVPVMLAHNEQRTAGVFWHNAAETWIDVSSNIADRGMFSKLLDFVKGDDKIPQVDTHWFSESGIIDLFVMLGPEPKDVFRQYATLTGSTPLPPLFSIAYHQSRWNYNDEQDVANVDAGFDEHDIPMDVIWLDIEHTDGKRYFTWDAHKFPHSEEMLKNVSAKGRKMVNIVDPHIKKDSNYFIFKEMEAEGLFIKNKDGNNYEGWCWPGSSYWPDFTDPKIRKFWATKFDPEHYQGTTHDLFVWNDMNEPSVFNGPEITMHKDAKHFGDWEHRDVHNMYGTYVHQATYEGLMLRGDNKERPFVLSRAFFAGSQRYGAVWTGDNTGEWGHLKISIPMILTLNLVGITFSGADVGGFFKNPDHELLTRWYQAAVYQPFLRAHAHLDTRRREPWLLPDHHKTAIREALRARYRLLPYWYTLFRQGETEGTPVMRPMWVEFPKVKDVFREEEAHMVGSALLVRPVTDAGATSVSLFLPGDNEVWYDRDTYQAFRGNQQLSVPVDLNKIPVFQRGGHIVPQKNRIRRSASLMLHDPYTLVATLNTQGKAEGELYEDDFTSFQYKNGRYIHRKFTFENNQFTSKCIRPGSGNGVKSEAWLERIILVGYPRQPSKVTLSSGNNKSQLGFDYDANRRVLTIRKPGTNIDSDFTVGIE